MLSKIDIMKLQELPIESVANALGLSVNRHKSLCPFHDDSNPSLTFNVRKNRYRCFVCDAHGGTIDLVMNHLHKDFLSACRWLADDTNIILSLDPHSALDAESHHEPLTMNREPKVFDASRYERFFERPWLSNEAKRFLFEERMLDPRVVRYCRLTSWRDRQGTPWLQIPYYDREGHLIGIQNRNLSYGSKSLNSSKGSNPSNLSNLSNPSNPSNLSNPSNPSNPSNLSNPSNPSNQAPRFRFPSGSRCSIYNLPVLNLLKKGEPLFLTEGCSDCWAMLSAGHKAIAIPSATLLSRKDIELLGTLNVELGTPFHIFPDQDVPGEQLYNRLVEASVRHGFILLRHQLPSGCKDFSEYYLQRLGNPSSLIPQPSTLIPHPSTLNPHPSTLIPHPSTTLNVKC